MASKFAVQVVHFRWKGPRVTKAALATVTSVLWQAASDLTVASKAVAPVRTGRLKGSIHPERPVIGRKGEQIVVDVVADAKDPRSGVSYPVFVALGTRYMAARPFLQRPGERISRRLEDRLRQELQRLR